MSKITESQDRLATFLKGKQYNALAAAVTGVRDGLAEQAARDDEPAMKVIWNYWADRLTTALDAAPATGDGATDDKGKWEGDFYNGFMTIPYRPSGYVRASELVEMMEKFGEDSSNCVIFDHLNDLIIDAPPPPAPVGIDPAAVRKVRDAMAKLWDLPTAGEQFSGWEFAIRDLTALIAAAGEQGPAVPVAVVDEGVSYFWTHPLTYHALKIHIDCLLAPYRRPAPPADHLPDATKKVCETCDIPGLVWREGYQPCPDCAKPDAELPRCPLCGYTKEDEAFHMDHHLCEAQGGKIPASPDTPDATEPVKTEPDECCTNCAKYWKPKCPLAVDGFMKLKNRNRSCTEYVADAPAPPTTEQRAAYYRAMLSHHNSLHKFIDCIIGDKDQRVTAWLDAQAQGGGDDARPE